MNYKCLNQLTEVEVMKSNKDKAGIFSNAAKTAIALQDINTTLHFLFGKGLLVDFGDLLTEDNNGHDDAVL